MAEESGRLRWKLAQVVAVADDAPGLTDRELRDRLLATGPSRVPRVPPARVGYLAAGF